MVDWSTLWRKLGWGGVERRRRTIAKTIGYRVVMVLVTVVVAFAVTRDLSSAVDIGIAANVVKTVVYYLYERLWSRIAWGTTAE